MSSGKTPTAKSGKPAPRTTEIPPGKLIGAILAYRGVFELLPLVVALVGFMLVEARNKTRAAVAEDIKEARA